MHKDELEINEKLVKALLKIQCPHWANLPIRPITSSGTDHRLFRLGIGYVIRFPRIEWVPRSINKSIAKEYEWVPKIARFLETSISEPLFKCSPDKSYPFSWTIVKWKEGRNPNFKKENEHELLAKDLAYFLNDLHQIKLSDGPLSRRGVSLKEVDEQTKKAINQLEGEIDIELVTSIWDRLSNTPSWNQEPVWMHGDFLPGNILVLDGRLNAVIDFSDVGIGDPACDLIVAWSLLQPHSRKIFKENLEGIDEDTWTRGQGWALSIALIILPYYRNSNLTLTTLATQMIKNVLSDLDNT